MSTFVSKHWFLSLLSIGLGLALLFPEAMRQATDFLDPRRTIAFSLFLMAWTMPTRSLVVEVRRPYAALWAIAISYGLVPPLGWALGFLPPLRDVQVGLVIISAAPCTLASAILWTRLAGGNEATALLTVMGTTFTSWGLTTAWLFALTGTTLELDVADMMWNLFLILILPVVAGQALRRIPIGNRLANRYRVVLGAISQSIILAIILKTGTVVGDELHRDPSWAASMVFVASIGLTLAVHLIVVGFAYYSSQWLGMEHGRKIAVAFAASQKTLPVGLVLYDQYFRADYPFAVMPVLAYHVGQLLVDTVLAKRWARHVACDASPEADLMNNV